jgi:putative oxidoreductase
MEWLFGTYPSWSHLVVRLGLGVIFVAHGAQKLFGWFGGHGLRGTVAYFREALGIPAPATVVAALLEFGGGVCLLLGFLARPAALGILIVMAVAVAKVHAPHGFFLNFALTPGRGHGYEFNLALMAMALSILLGGAGILSVDRALVAWGVE